MMIAFGLYLTLKCLGGSPLTFFEVFKAAILGNYGRGAYYYHLMIEFVLLAPALYGILRRFEENGIILIGLANFIYDVLCSAYGFPDSFYRVIVFRYLFAIVLGMYIGRYRERRISSAVLGMMTAIGVIYILLPYAWEYSYRIFTYNPWGRTSMMAVLYAFPIVYILLDGFGEYKSRSALGRAVEKIGRSSYHILYTQMIYYTVRPTFDRMIFDISKFGYAELIMDIVIPIVSGILFELYISKASVKRV